MEGNDIDAAEQRGLDWAANYIEEIANANLTSNVRRAPHYTQLAHEVRLLKRERRTRGEQSRAWLPLHIYGSEELKKQATLERPQLGEHRCKAITLLSGKMALVWYDNSWGTNTVFSWINPPEGWRQE